MKKIQISRQTLESSSTSDLLAIADELGIDIPSDLNRQFIIGELLEASEYEKEDDDADKDVNITQQVTLPEKLPLSYNETTISVALRNPAWAFVFWDIREADEKIIKNENGTLSLHVAFLTEADSEKSEDSFDIQINLKDREQYVHIPGGKKYFAIQLVLSTDENPQNILAVSPCIELPQENEIVNSIQPGKEIECTELEKLSGMEDILRTHYRNHRQSFL